MREECEVNALLEREEEKKKKEEEEENRNRIRRRSEMVDCSLVSLFVFIMSSKVSLLTLFPIIQCMIQRY